MKRITLKRSTLSSAILVCIGQLMVSQPVFAGVHILTDDVTVQTQAAPTQYFSQNGVSGDQVVVIKGGGDVTSLSLAAKLIIPPEWKINFTGDYQKKSVYWNGGVSWPHIIKNIADVEGIFVSLDWVKKIANIHVPESESIQTASNVSEDKLAEERKEYELKSKAEWARRDDNLKKVAEEKSRTGQMLTQFRASQEEDQKFIAKLNLDNAKLTEERLEVQAMLEKERAKRKELEDKYSVIDPTLNNAAEKKDSTDLYIEYNEHWVLPFDDSFEYYIKGGHADVILASTPATFIAKQGYVKDIMIEWARETNWHLDYRSQVKHKNPYQVSFKGSLFEASTEFISLYLESRRPLDINFYPDVKPIIDGVAKDGLIIVEDLEYKKK